MNRSIAALLLAVLAVVPTASAQSPRFEVASVKQAPHDEDAPAIMRGGPGSKDPERINFERVSFGRLLHAAYGLDYDQISGPSWIGTEQYTVVAKVPAGATKEQVMLMWQDLLAARFQLKAHLTKKDFPAYALSSKGASKLRKSGEGPVVKETGFPEPRPGEVWGMLVIQPRTIRLTFRKCSMEEFIRRISWPLSTPVRSSELTLGRIVDRTGLEGLFDFTLEFAGFMGPGGAFPPPLPDGQADTAPLLLDALRQQLGFQLTETKTRLDALIVDHAEKVPTEN
jgi:uncharacterized protein (TIGR03435 family)